MQQFLTVYETTQSTQIFNGIFNLLWNGLAYCYSTP